MRLWHKDFINVLPRQQLLSQLRECVLIAKNIHDLGKPNHILVNPIMNYPLEHFVKYVDDVISTIEVRGYRVKPETIEKIKSYLNIKDFRNNTRNIRKIDLFYGWHDETYFDICFYNLLEKFKCGGIPEAEFKLVLDRYFFEKYINVPTETILIKFKGVK